MKKLILCIIFLCVFCFSLSAQTSNTQGPIDLVVLVDTSVNMSSSYQETINYLIGPFLTEFLHLGDTFHLISFSDTPRLEISRRVDGMGDVESVIGRIMLLYPIDPSSNIDSALTFAERYISTLPGGRPKKLVLISGDNSPSAHNAVSSVSGRLSPQGTDLQFIPMPLGSTAPVSGRPAPAPAAAQPAAQPPAQPPAAQQPPATQPPPAQPPAAQQQPPVSQTPATQPPPAQPPAAQQQPPVSQTPATQPPPAQPPAAQQQPPATQPPPAAEAPGTQPPATQPPPAQQPPAAQTPGTQPPAAQTQPGQTPIAPSPPRETGDYSQFLLIGLILLALLGLGLIVFLVSRKLQSSPNRAMSKAVFPASVPKDTNAFLDSYASTKRSQERPSPDAPQNQRRPLPYDFSDNLTTEPITEGEPVLLNLFVEDQNTAIGRRNIHMVKPGASLSVGGGNSDFLIFLVPVPQGIAEVNFNGRTCTLTPKNPKFFPDLGTQSVQNCIGKTVRVMTEKNYELHIRVERFKDPLKALNELLNSITVPGETQK